MREIQIDLSTTGKIVDDVTFSVGATAKTVEEESCFYNYFFFTATSVNFVSSTMTLKYDEYPGWTPEAWLAICSQDVARETYAIKIKTPKYSSSTSGVENRTVYAVGNIQTDSLSVNSDYNIAVRTNACPEIGDYRLLYVTNVNDDETYTIMNSSGREEEIVFNVQYIVKKNIDFFTGDDDEGHDKKEATMLNIVARKEWGEYDGDWGSYATSPAGDCKYEAYKTCEGQSDTEPNARIVKKDNATILGSGFFNLESGSLSKLGYLSAYTFNDETGTGEGKFIFTKPLEAIGYHTFFFGKHFNERNSEPALGDEYLDYRDSNGNWQRFSRDSTDGNGEWQIGGEDWIDFDDKLNCERDKDKDSNEVNVYFDELNDIITSIKTGKYLRIIGNQAFKLLKNLEEVDLEGSPLERIGMYAFEGCFSLNTFEIPDSVVLMGEGAFKKSGISEVKIPSGLKYIESETFRLCDNLSSVDFSSCTGLTKICTNAFRQTNLGSLSLPSGLKNIEKTAFANCDNLSNITFNDDLEYIGYKAFNKCNSLISLEIPAETIGEMAFNKCEGLQNVTLKSSVRTVKSYAFDHCNINTLTIENGLKTIEPYAFCDIDRVTSIELPDSVLTIGKRAFAENDYLETVRIGNGVRDIGDYIFGGNYGITITNIGNKVEHIGKGVFEYSIIEQANLPSTLITIGAMAFIGCSGLSTLSIPNSVISLGESAFSGCKDITSLAISTSMTEIKPSTFEACTNITSVYIPNSITSIEDRAFNNCTSLSPLTLPINLNSIGWRAFAGCRSIPAITIPKTVNSIASEAFELCTGVLSVEVEYDNTKYDSRNNCNAIIETATNKLLFGCRNTTIPNGVTSIDANAFRGCGFTSIIIPNSVTSIGSQAFRDCSNLTNVTISESVTSIEYETFYGCSSLTSVVIPDSVTKIGDNAFHYCENLTAITIGDNVTEIGSGAFSECKNLTEVALPLNLKTLGNYAFNECKRLLTFTYPGTKAKWNKINRPLDWIDVAGKDTLRVICSDGNGAIF